MKYCGKCGNGMNDDASICVKCGNPCNGNTGQATINERLLLFLLSVFMPCVGFFVGLLLNDNDKKASKMCFIGTGIGVALEALFVVIIPLLKLLPILKLLKLLH